MLEGRLNESISKTRRLLPKFPPALCYLLLWCNPVTRFASIRSMIFQYSEDHGVFCQLLQWMPVITSRLYFERVSVYHWALFSPVMVQERKRSDRIRNQETVSCTDSPVAKSCMVLVWPQEEKERGRQIIGFK